MALLNDLQELVQEGVISQNTAADITRYYQSQKGDSGSRIMTIFAVLGALLIGLGIILIVAHNWDDFTSMTKTVLVLLPLLIGQGLCFYTLRHKTDSSLWRESTTTFTIMCIGASIAFIGQIYHIPGDLSTFLLTWCCLSIPLIYIMESSMAALLTLLGGMWYATVTYGYRHQHYEAWPYWLIIGAVVPYYYHLLSTRTRSNYTVSLSWLLPLSLTIALGMFLPEQSESVLIVGFMALGGVCYMISYLPPLAQWSLGRNGWRVLGALGSIYILLLCGFTDVWTSIVSDYAPDSNAVFPTAVVFGIACYLLWKHYTTGVISLLTPIMPLFLVFAFVFLVATVDVITATILCNLLVLAIAIITIRKGVMEDHLGILNYGLLVMTALLMSKFFDYDLSFVTRGLLFILVGISFFVANRFLIKKRREHVS